MQRIHRAEHDEDHPFTQVSNVTLDDLADDPEALTVLLHILKYSDEWRVRPLSRVDELRLSKNRIYRALLRLVNKGYLEREDVRRNEKGRWQSSYMYFVHEVKLPTNGRGQSKRWDALDSVAKKGWAAAV